MSNIEKYLKLIGSLPEKVKLVAVSKTQSADSILEIYKEGQRDFGENYVQELLEKQALLPKDINWHFIGHLQTNKVKQIAPFVRLIHGVDSLKLLTEINKQALKNNRVIDCLLQIHIAEEETKFGLDESELQNLLNDAAIDSLKNVRICGLMGMASFTTDKNKVKLEFGKLKTIFTGYKSYFKIENPILSMGMSSDFETAISEGSNLIRVGSLIFGERNYGKK